MLPRENVLPIDESRRVIEPNDRRIGTILFEAGKLRGADIERILELQKVQGVRFGEAALGLGLISAEDLRVAVARQYDLPHVLPGSESVSGELVVAYEPFNPRAEELRALRTQLLIRWTNAGVRHRVLAVVSPVDSRASQTAATLLSPATVPTKASYPILALNIALSLVVGLMLGMASVIMIEMSDRRVRSIRDLELDVPLLAVLNTWRPVRGAPRLGGPGDPARVLPSAG